MAWYTCTACGEYDHFREFLSGTHIETDPETFEDTETDVLSCPNCGCEDLVEE